MFRLRMDLVNMVNSFRVYFHNAKENQIIFSLAILNNSLTHLTTITGWALIINVDLVKNLYKK